MEHTPTGATDQVAPFNAVIISEKGLWWRRFLALLLAVIIVLFTVSIQQTNQNQGIGDGNRNVLCALALDDALSSEAVAKVYVEECGPLPRQR